MPMPSVTIRKTALTITSLITLVASSPALADSLEEYLTKMVKGEIDSKMIHEEAKFLLLVGPKSVALDKTQVIEAAKAQLPLGATTNILDLKIISRSQTGNIVSVISRIKARAKVGSTEIVFEQTSHDLLLKSDDSFVTVFSIVQQ